MSSSPNLSVVLLATPHATTSVLYGLYDVFSSVGRDWSLLIHGTPGASRVNVRVVAHQAAPFAAANGVWVHPDEDVATAACPDVICMPDLLLPPGARLEDEYGPVLGWLRRCHAQGATVAAVCSGAMMLAQSGLLDGFRATTHWAYCATLQAAHPTVRVEPNQVIVADGDGHRLITAGGGATWMDLALYLVARFFGQDEAMNLARLYLVDWHGQGQLPYAALSRVRQTQDKVIETCQVWLAEHYATPNPVAGMVAVSGLTERSFKRRFKAATGMSPLTYVHALRIEEAKQVLESEDQPVDEVAAQIGYEDGSFFRRLFRRRVGMAPSAYRRKFQPMRRALGRAAG